MYDDTQDAIDLLVDRSTGFGTSGKVSTMTLGMRIAKAIDTVKLVRDGENRRSSGLVPTKKGVFKNCDGCMFRVPYGEKKFKSVKVFRNGKIHLTGIQSGEQAIAVIRVVVENMPTGTVIDVDAKSIEPYMINVYNKLDTDEVHLQSFADYLGRLNQIYEINRNTCVIVREPPVNKVKGATYKVFKSGNVLLIG